MAGTAVGTPPEIKRVLAQVEAELNALVAHGDIGSITVHCGPGDLLVEVTAKRRYKPVRLERAKLIVAVTP